MVYIVSHSTPATSQPGLTGRPMGGIRPQRSYRCRAETYRLAHQPSYADRTSFVISASNNTSLDGLISAAGTPCINRLRIPLEAAQIARAAVSTSVVRRP